MIPELGSRIYKMPDTGGIGAKGRDLDEIISSDGLIDMDELDSAQKTSQDNLRGLLKQIVPNPITADAFGKSFAKVLLGSERKEIVSENGETQLIDWTDDEIFEGLRLDQKEADKGFREGMAEELTLAMGYQWMAFRTQRTPEAMDANNNIIFVSALLQRVVASDTYVSAEYPIEHAETHTQAMVLEAIRRIVLKPSYIMHGGVGDGGINVPEYDDRDFWWNVLPEQHKKIQAKQKNLDDHDEYRKLQREQIGDNVERVTLEEWKEIVQWQKEIFLRYLKEASKRGTNNLFSHVRFNSRLTRGGQRLFDEEYVEAKTNEATNARDLAGEIQGLEDFSQVRDLIKSKMGRDADYIDLLQALDPIDLKGEDPSDFRHKHFMGV